MTTDIFRREAIEYRQVSRAESPLLLVWPGWAAWTYRLLLFLVAISVSLAVVAPLPRHVQGTALIRAGSPSPVSAQSSGMIDTLLVEPGTFVSTGAAIVRFHAAEEEQQLRALTREIDSTVIQMLAHPDDAVIKRTVASLTAQASLLRARVDSRTLVAPRDGRVLDVRVKPGQYVNAGDVILTLSSEGSRLLAVALLPGDQRPFLHVGQSLRLELSGVRHSYIDATITHVDESVVGPAEARRILGADVADAVALSGPQAVVLASLPEPTFEFDGRRFEYP